MSSSPRNLPSDLVLFPSQLYENALTENQKLKTKLQEAQLELADIKAKLEKMAQVRKGEQSRGGRSTRKAGGWVEASYLGDRLGDGVKVALPLSRLGGSSYLT